MGSMQNKIFFGLFKFCVECNIPLLYSFPDLFSKKKLALVEPLDCNTLRQDGLLSNLVFSVASFVFLCIGKKL